uniref:Pept_C1 domain-containing protein n=1 Tax=Meloidogyne hapla TaxID=6305 RepID=A0A1I8BBD8_MELHA
MNAFHTNITEIIDKEAKIGENKNDNKVDKEESKKEIIINAKGKEKENKKEDLIINLDENKNNSLSNNEKKKQSEKTKIEETLKESSKNEKIKEVNENKEENKHQKVDENKKENENEEKLKEKEKKAKILKGRNNLRKSEKETRLGRKNKNLSKLIKEKKQAKGLKGKWKSGINEPLALLSDEEIEMLGGDVLPQGMEETETRTLTRIEPSNVTEPELKFVGKIVLEDNDGEPTNVTCDDYVFDIRDKWPECTEIINNIRDQSLCKDCWAVSATSSFTDRRCIEMVKNKIPIEVTDSFFSSAYDTAVCSDSPNLDACTGGSSGLAWQWFEKVGVVSGHNYQMGGCIPYPFPPISQSETIPQYAFKKNCKEICSNTAYGNETFEYELDKRKAKNVKALYSTNLPQGQKSWENLMKEEIFNNGSISASFLLHKDFVENYKSGIYNYIESPCAGRGFNGGCIGHAVRLIGYGNYTCSDGSFQKYWLGVNSFGNKWGELNGFFKFVRGINELDIEKRQIAFGTPII